MEWDCTLLAEDDSLIQQNTPKPPSKPSDFNRISPLKGFKVSKDPVPVKLNCLSPKDTSNKENVSANKFEGQKLNMEPVQMKKKKKGAGYNLRKSLAWNRAFFTEEGVLDPTELSSMISGTLGNSSSEGLSAINEEAMDSFADVCQFNTDSANLQALEKNLSKESSAALSRNDRQAVSLPPKRTSPARTHQASTFTASHKVLSTHTGRRTGPRAGSSPQSLPSSSLKRPANINTHKAVTKESKLPKLPVPKPVHPSFLANNNGAIRGTTSSKQNQILRPVVNVQKNMELKSYPKSAKMPQSKAKAGSESLRNKSSAPYAKRNKVNPPVNLHASTQVCPVVGNKVDISDPKVTPDDVPLSVKVNSSEGQDVTSQLAASLSSNNAITGRTLQHTQIQSTKPSGLRMPSPSLGYFGQSVQTKALVSHCLSRRVDSNPRVGKLGNWRPPQLPAKIPEVVNSNMLISNAMVSNSRYDLNAVSNETASQGLVEDARRDVEKISHESEHCELESDKQNIAIINDTNEKLQNHVKNETSVLLEKDRGAEMNGDKLILDTVSCGHLTEDDNANNSSLGHRASRETFGTDSEHFQFFSQQNRVQSAVDGNRTRTALKSQSPHEEKFENSAVIDDDVSVESQTGNVSDSTVLNSVMLRNNPASCIQDLHQPSCFHTDSLETSAVEEFLIPDVDKPSMVKEDSSKMLVGDLQNHASKKIGNKNSGTLELTKFKPENSEFSSQDIHAGQLEDSFMMNGITDNSHIKKTVLQIPNVILTASCKNSLQQSIEVGDLGNPFGMILESQAACFEVEQISNSVHGLPTDGCMFLEKATGSEQCQQEVIETFPSVISDERVESKIDNSGAEIEKLFVGMEGEGFDTKEMAGQDCLRNSKLGSVEVYPSVANDGFLLDTNIISDVVFSSEDTSLDLCSYSSEASEFFVEGAHRSFNGNKVRSREDNEKNVRTLEPAHQILFDGPCLESQIADVNHTGLSSESEVCDKEQKCDIQNIVETDSILHGYSQIEMEKFCTLPQVALLRQTSEAGTETAKVPNIARTGDDPEHLADGNVAVQSCMGYTSVACNQYASGVNFTEESEQTESFNCCRLVEEVFESNSKLLLRTFFYDETSECAKFEESRFSGNSVDAKPEKAEPCESELKSSREFTDTPLSPLPLENNGHDGATFNSGSCTDETSSSCIEIELSSEKCKLPSGNQIRQSVEIGGLLVGEDLTLPKRLNQSIHLTNSALTDEIKPEVCHEMDSFLEDSHCDLDNSLHREKDENESVPIGSKKSVSTSNRTNLIPPRNVVPFSDEWLAAMEAAGEEIFTMKSGAVQNSPPDKSLPEPSPWSPVKRKNNAIGPYDCTKFTNNLSSDPQ